MEKRSVAELKDGIEQIVGDIVSLVTENPVDVNVLAGSGTIIVEVTPHPSECGIVVGQRGRLAHAVRSVLQYIGGRNDVSILYQVITPEDREGLSRDEPKRVRSHKRRPVEPTPLNYARAQEESGPMNLGFLGDE
jgi:predicted RNA-binding protein YlqC (UPF0109 family)